MANHEPTSADIFSGGAGGWTLGLHRAGFKTLAASEIDPWRREIYAANWKVPVCDDVRKFGSDWWSNNVNAPFPWLLAGSPPCKEYSPVNSRGGGLDKDDLFLEAVRVTDELRPAWACFENSPHIRTKGFDRISTAMEAINYSIWPLVVAAANAGAAHRRARVWIICADASRAQGWPTRQPWGLPSMVTNTNRAGLRIEQGRRLRESGEVAPISFDHSAILGPVGSWTIGEHIREYDGIPSRISEQCRSAYGDAVCPIIPEIIGRSIRKVCGV